VDALGHPVHLPITAGNVADVSEAVLVIEAAHGANFIADKGYDADAVVDAAQAKGMNVVIPPRSNRINARPIRILFSTRSATWWRTSSVSSSTFAASPLATKNGAKFPWLPFAGLCQNMAGVRRENHAHEALALKANDVTEQIIACAIEVHRARGPGLLESAYEACWVYELAERGLSLQRQTALPVIYQRCPDR
jgi:transposase